MAMETFPGFFDSSSVPFPFASSGSGSLGVRSERQVNRWTKRRGRVAHAQTFPYRAVFYNCAILSEHERRRSKGEAKDPEDVSSALPMQGVLTRMGVLPFPAMREGRFYKFWVYIMCSRTGTLYIGMTGFVDTPIFQHKSGEIDGFTKKYKCDRLGLRSSLVSLGISPTGSDARRAAQLRLALASFPPFVFRSGFRLAARTPPRQLKMY